MRASNFPRDLTEAVKQEMPEHFLIGNMSEKHMPRLWPQQGRVQNLEGPGFFCCFFLVAKKKRIVRYSFHSYHSQRYVKRHDFDKIKVPSGQTYVNIIGEASCSARLGKKATPCWVTKNLVTGDPDKTFAAFCGFLLLVAFCSKKN